MKDTPDTTQPPAVNTAGNSGGAWLDSGSVASSMKRYRITWPHDHDTLRIGDVVVMTETPSHENMLLREPDMTLHRVSDQSGQYVHLIEAAMPKNQ